MRKFTRLCCNTQGSAGPTTITINSNSELPQQITANRRGVLAATDTENVSLHVEGDVSIDGRQHCSELVSDEFYQVSDARKKHNIHRTSLEESLKIVTGLQPHSYQYKNGSGKQKTGFIAQQAQQLDKDLVLQTSDGSLALDYGSIHVHTTSVVQHLLSEMRELKKQVAEKQE